MTLVGEIITGETSHRDIHLQSQPIADEPVSDVIMRAQRQTLFHFVTVKFTDAVLENKVVVSRRVEDKIKGLVSVMVLKQKSSNSRFLHQ